MKKSEIEKVHKDEIKTIYPVLTDNDSNPSTKFVTTSMDGFIKMIDCNETNNGNACIKKAFFVC